MLKLGVLCSGNLGYSVLVDLVRKYRTVCVFTDSHSNQIIDFSNKNQIPYFTGNPRKGKGFDFIKNIDIDILISINYLFLIDRDLINKSRLLTFNIHGSLLPKYRGRTPHVWAIINDEIETGITAHEIDEGCDTGRILEQVVIPIKDDDTGGSLLEKFKKNYFRLIEKVIDQIITNTLQPKKQDESKAFYFGKRTAQDGIINWRWPKRRIYNWVRAQADPYPGAYTFLDNEKLVIDKVICLDKMSNISKFKNGEIVEVSPNLMVKVSDGFIILKTIRSNSCNFEVGKIFQNEDWK